VSDLCMDLDDFTPAGGGSLRDQYGTREPVATFTEALFTHPDDIWHPLGGELDQSRPQRAPPRQDRKAGHAEHPHAETARMVRSALRG
jgi:hypothetical protein